MPQLSRTTCARRKRLALGILALTMPCALHAQPTDWAATDDPVELEDVTVTAPLNEAFEISVGGFGNKDVMDVPLAIQRYDAQTIADIAPRTVADVLTVLDPSVTSSSFGGGFDNFRLRGFSGDLFNTLRIDGLALAPHQDMPMELVERVDVLKGPAGFLYGFNSPGGSINYQPKRPTKEPFTHVNVQASYLNGRYAALDNSASFADGAFGYRFNTGYSKTGNFNHFGDFERKFIGATMDLRLSPAALLQINTNWTDTQSMTDPLLRADQSSRSDPLNPSSYILPPEVNRRHALSPSWFRHGIEASNVDAKLEYTLNERWTAVGQWNFSRVKHDAAYNDLFDIQTNGDIGYAALAIRRASRYDSWTGQIYLTGALETGPVLHEVFFGASHHMNHDRSPLWDVQAERVFTISVRGPLCSQSPSIQPVLAHQRQHVPHGVAAVAVGMFDGGGHLGKGLPQRLQVHHGVKPEAAAAAPRLGDVAAHPAGGNQRFGVLGVAHAHQGAHHDGAAVAHAAHAL